MATTAARRDGPVWLQQRSLFWLGVGLVVVLLAFLGFMYVRISLQRPIPQPPAFNPAAVTATAVAAATTTNQR